MRSWVSFALSVLSVLSFGQSNSNTPPAPITASEQCGTCHQAIYREFQFGFGADMHYSEMVLRSTQDERLNMPAAVSGGATAHAAAGLDPFPAHSRDVEENGRSCNVCHFPQSFAIPPLDTPELAKPNPRPKEQQAQGLECVSCHMTPEGTIRAPHEVANAPHAVVVDPKIQSSAMCAYCHAVGKRVIGKQTQTFLEWRDDFFNAGLGKQQCQDCHMPRTIRKVAEDFDVPFRPVARHLWTGGHSPQRLESALNLTLVQAEQESSTVEFHLVNIGAGHSVPTGSNRRGLYLRAEVLNPKGVVIAKHEWLFAPSYGNRPDDKSFLEDDKKREDRVAATQADEQGPHESTIRAGEERILSWMPNIAPGKYRLRASVIYDLNRYNDPNFKADQTLLDQAELDLAVGSKR
jgi:hypothetical protein